MSLGPELEAEGFRLCLGPVRGRRRRPDRAPRPTGDVGPLLSASDNQTEWNRSAALSTFTETVATVSHPWPHGKSRWIVTPDDAVASSEGPTSLSKPLPISRPRSRSSRVLCSAVSRSRTHVIAPLPPVFAIQGLLSESMPSRRTARDVGHRDRRGHPQCRKWLWASQLPRARTGRAVRGPAGILATAGGRRNLW
jgi:hypothetical protein